ncbi:MAG TPA: hypothetical protein ENK19_01625, partial [Acidobacteria bacterium]|nr:hypothetical protein [Acidobacteriota bacterium]
MRMTKMWTAALMAVAMTGTVWAQQAKIPAQSTDPNKVLLKVNGEPIKVGTVNLVMASLRADAARGASKLNPQDLGKQAMERAVDSLLLAQEARREGIKPDLARVDKQIA